MDSNDPVENSEVAQPGPSPNEGGGNPYAAPADAPSDVDATGAIIHYGDATRGARFVNFLIDIIVIGVIEGGVNFGLAAAELGDIGGYVDLAVFAGYYVAMEGLTGRTLGKMVTGTRVIRQVDFRKPTLADLALRTAIRIIPFEAFSALWGAQMWHDRWSKTRTVRVRRKYDDELPDRVEHAYDPF
jgi:uncharacterized RDD family membrane protein YckC